jgi:hypothetical protein
MPVLMGAGAPCMHARRDGKVHATPEGAAGATPQLKAAADGNT